MTVAGHFEVGLAHVAFRDHAGNIWAVSSRDLFDWLRRSVPDLLDNGNVRFNSTLPWRPATEEEALRVFPIAPGSLLEPKPLWISPEFEVRTIEIFSRMNLSALGAVDEGEDFLAETYACSQKYSPQVWGKILRRWLLTGITQA